MDSVFIGLTSSDRVTFDDHSTLAEPTSRSCVQRRSIPVPMITTPMTITTMFVMVGPLFFNQSCAASSRGSIWRGAAIITTTGTNTVDAATSV